jgi:hypothetical protein
MALIYLRLGNTYSPPSHRVEAKGEEVSEPARPSQAYTPSSYSGQDICVNSVLKRKRMAEARAADERLRGFLRKAGRNADSDTPKGYGYGSTSIVGEYEGDEDNGGMENPEVQCV